MEFCDILSYAPCSNILFLENILSFIPIDTTMAWNLLGPTTQSKQSTYLVEIIIGRCFYLCDTFNMFSGA